MTGKYFTCAECGDRCLSNWSEEEARAEYKRRFGIDVEKSPFAVTEVCTDCYRKLMGERLQ